MGQEGHRGYEEDTKHRGRGYQDTDHGEDTVTRAQKNKGHSEGHGEDAGK